VKRKAVAKPKAAKKRRRTTTVTKAELESLRAEVKRLGGGPARWNADPEDVQRSVVRLVLALVEFLRKVMERQAIRRMEAGTLEPQQIEDMGLALMRLEETVTDLAARFGLTPEELNLDLGPLGKLM
jgi:predicted RNase H-like nuclease (RuvC/YqgF family)